MIFLRQTLMFFAVLGFVQAPVVSASQAQAAPTKTEQEVDDILELLPPARHGETIAELYDRLSPRLPGKYRVEFVDLYQNIHMKAVPEIKVEGRKVTITDGKNKAVIRVEVKNGNDVQVFLNDQGFTEKDLKSVDALAKRVVEIAKMQKKKNAAMWWSLAVPRAQAGFMDDIPWGWVLGGVAVGVIGTLLYQKLTAPSTPTAAAQCQYGANECCQVNGAYVAGCCNQYAASTPGVQRITWLSAANCVMPSTATSTSSLVAPGTGTPIYKNATSAGAGAATAKPATAKPAFGNPVFKPATSSDGAK